MKKIEIQDFLARPSVARPFPVRDGLCQKAGLLIAFFTTIPIAIGTTRQGTGLGLSLSYDIVKAHGGEIFLMSKADEGPPAREAGTEFIIHLPII